MKLYEILEAEQKKQPKRYTIKHKEPFPVWIRSKQEFLKIYREKFKSGGIKLSNIVKLYTLYNYRLGEKIILDVSPDALFGFREYDRFNDIHKEKFKELEKNILKNNIKDPLILKLKKNGNTLEVSLGEGNHRLGIALYNDLKQVPIRLRYID